MTPAQETALTYTARSWNPTPIPHMSKKPMGMDWQKRIIREADVPIYFNGHPLNVGVILGPTSEGLTDVDLDCAEAIALASYVLQRTGSMFGRESAPASHRLYRTTLASKSDTEKAAIQFLDPMKPSGENMLLEVRVGGVKGAQTVFPGSVHESGEAVRWDEDNEPATVNDQELLGQAHLLASICLLARYWPGTGARHDAALSIGGFLARAGLPAPTIKYLAEAIARTAGDPEVKDRRDTAEDAAQAFHAGKPARGFPLLCKTFGDAVAKQVADWLAYSGSWIDDGTIGTEPIEPVDLWAKFDPPSLPRGLLPPLLEEFAFDRGMVMGCDMAGIAVGTLAACAASITDAIKLQVKRNDTEWQESARVWMALVGDVSEMKTPMMNAILSPVRQIDNAMARSYVEAKNEWLRLPPPLKKVTAPPKKLRARIMDVTVEAVQDILQDSPNGVLLDQDELSGWFGSMDKYNGSKGAQADRGFWLKAYNGGSYISDRVSRDTCFIENLSVSALGFIQPEPIRKIANTGEDDGLLQRFTPLILRPAVRGQDTSPGAAVAEYDRLIQRLRQLRPPKSGNLYPPDAVLMFDDGALAIRDELERKHLELTRIKSINRKLSSHISKYNGMFARLCVIWHCVEHAFDAKLPVIVAEHTAKRVASFMHDFLLKHATRVLCGHAGAGERPRPVSQYRRLHPGSQKDPDHQPRYRTRRPQHAEPEGLRNRADLRTARSPGLADADPRPALQCPAELGRQSGRASEVRGTGQSRTSAAGGRSQVDRGIVREREGMSMPRTIRIITREEAKRSPRKTYFTGEPCQHGHVCERFIKRSWCVECARLGLKPERKPPAETFFGKPCRSGHTERYVISGECVACVKERSKKAIAREHASGRRW